MNSLHRHTLAAALAAGLSSAQAYTPTLAINYANAGTTSAIVPTSARRSTAVSSNSEIAGESSSCPPISRDSIAAAEC